MERHNRKLAVPLYGIAKAIRLVRYWVMQPCFFYPIPRPGAPSVPRLTGDVSRSNGEGELT